MLLGEKIPAINKKIKKTLTKIPRLETKNWAQECPPNDPVVGIPKWWE